MKLNIENVETYIPLYKNSDRDQSLAFGKKPTYATFCDDRKKINAVINLQKLKTQKDPWYIEKHNVKHYACYPLETERIQEDDCEKEIDLEVEEVVKKVIYWLNQYDHIHVFIHGYECNRFACIVAMVCWKRMDPAIENPIQTLRQNTCQGEKALEEDFPATEDHQQQIDRLLKKHKHSIVACFESSKKKIKK